MSLRTLLITPWYCTSRSLHWAWGVIFVLCAICAVIAGVFESMPGRWVDSAMFLCFGLFFTWMFFFSNALLLAIDARTLRMPGTGRHVAASLLLYGVLGIVPATVILGALGGNMPNTATLLLLSTTAGLGVAILPRYLALALVLFPGISAGLSRVIDIPGPQSPQFPHWALPAALFLLLTDMLRWRYLLRSEKRISQGLSSTLVMRLRNKRGWGVFGTCGTSGSTSLIRNRPDWMQPGADLRRIGPRWPVRALRVALGGWYVPRTLTGQLRMVAPVLLPLLLLLPLILLIHFGEHPMEPFWQGFLSVFGVGFSIGWISIFGTLLLTVTGPVALRQRWTRVNCELPLLALLPGLGQRQHIKHVLLRATLGLPVIGLIALLALDLVVGGALHLDALGMTSVALSQIGSIVVYICLMLNVFGGHPVRRWVFSFLLSTLFILVSLSSFLPVTTASKHALVYVDPILLALIGIWTLLVLAMLWLARQSWRDLRDRPHAFLANAQ